MVENPAPAYRQVEELTERVVVSGRSYSGFNPTSGANVKLFGAVVNGNHLVRGFRNTDIRGAVRIDRGCRRTSSPEPRGGLNAEAIARARVDRESAAQAAVVRQPESPSGARSGNATVSLWDPRTCRSSGLIHR